MTTSEIKTNTSYKFRAESQDIDFDRIGREAAPDVYALWIETDRQRIIMVRSEKSEAFERLVKINHPGFTYLYRHSDGVLMACLTSNCIVQSPGWIFYKCPLPVPDDCMSRAQVAQAISKIRANEAAAKLEAEKVDIKVTDICGAPPSSIVTMIFRARPQDFDFDTLAARMKERPSVYALWVESPSQRVIMLRADKADAINGYLPYSVNRIGIDRTTDKWRTIWARPGQSSEVAYSCASINLVYCALANTLSQLTEAVRKVKKDEDEAKARAAAAKVNVRVEAF